MTSGLTVNMASSTDEDHSCQWREKCTNAEKLLLELKKLSHKSISDYEDLLRRYDQNQKQYEELKQRLQEREAEITSLQQVLEPVYNEYSDLEMRYNIERGCRDKAEEYATQIIKENKKLKRKSQMILSQLNSVDISFDELNYDTVSEVSTMTIEDQAEHFSKMMEDLQNKIVHLEQRLRQAEEERDLATDHEQRLQAKYQQEREARMRTATSLRHHEQQLKQFNRVSTQALEEFEDLRQKLEVQNSLKAEAERFATKMLSERDAMARESSILIASAASDERLAKSLLEIEDLNKKLELERHEHSTKIKELESNIARSEDIRQVTELEQRLQSAIEQIENLKQQLEDSQQWSSKQHMELEQLQSKLTDAEEKLKPPPPPPPPPLPPVGFFSPLRNILKKTNSGSPKPPKKSTPGQKAEPAYEKALEEMMERIKHGTLSLRPANKRRPSLPEMETQQQEKAVNGLHKMLVNLKRRSQSLGDIMDPTPGCEPGSPMQDTGETELAKTFNRIRGSQESLQMLNRNLGLIEEVEEDKLSPKNSGESLVRDKESKPGKVQFRTKSDCPPVSPRVKLPARHSGTQSAVVSTRM